MNYNAALISKNSEVADSLSRSKFLKEDAVLSPFSLPGRFLHPPLSIHNFSFDSLYDSNDHRIFEQIVDLLYES